MGKFSRETLYFTCVQEDSTHHLISKCFRPFILIRDKSRRKPIGVKPIHYTFTTV